MDFPITAETKKSLAAPFFRLVIVLGVFSLIYAIGHLRMSDIHFGYLVLAIVTLGIGSRVAVQIPGCRGQISISDTFLLLSLILYDVEASVLLAGADALASSLRLNTKKFLVAFNVSVFLCSTLTTGMIMRAFFGSVPNITADGVSPLFLLALTVMGMTQYIMNSGIVATAVALRAGDPVWTTWHKNFLWTSLTYFAGAFAAGIIAILSASFGLIAFLAIAPIIVIIYFTYRTYIKNIETAAAQAELAQAYVEKLNQHIAEQQRISNALKESEEHFRTAFDHAVGMALVSMDHRWLEVNESLSSLLGYTRNELQDLTLRDVVYSDDLGISLVRMQEIIDGESDTFQLESRYVHKDGGLIWVLSSASMVKMADGTPRHLVFQVQNISSRKQAEDQIRYAAFHDALTHLPNRTLLADRMGITIERAKRSTTYKFAVLFIDLDRFKTVNDTMGHEMGDKLLVDLAARLTNCVRTIDTVARLGGDEFAVLLDGITNDKRAIEIANRIQAALSKPFKLEGQEFFTSASIGIAFSASSYESPDEVLRDADIAMYRAKANGKARYEIFDERMHTRGVEALRTENELRRGIERGEITCFYQPIISLRTGAISGFEALARWIHPERGLVPPCDFIELAEETGLIVPLENVIFSEACQQLKRWQEMTVPGLTMSVNLSAKHFGKTGLVESIRKTIRNAAIRPETIHLEITESILIHNAQAAIDTLTQFKAIGVKLSIDDFGTGYSSLSYLHSFPFDIVKIDRSFVSRMSTDKNSLGIVETIITLADKLGKSIVAEGVETEEHRQALTQLACGYGQGFLFSKPIDKDTAETFILNGKFAETDHQSFAPIPDDIESLAGLYSM